ncbi:MAG: tetratricopeptide repeat protein [Proteobacteria bacterium]|nr:tetratricopeptide repeat protein [Pseudomonadota bacterium]MBU1715995.1 tetratricopeptide repeat protein [Pseudomonadota bacterium]
MMNKLIEDFSQVRNFPAPPIWLCLLLLVLTCLLVYANNYQGEFIFDDFVAIVDNPGVHSLYPVAPLLKPPPNTPLSARPVATISFALNYAVGGLDVRGYHLVNNLIHLLAGLALFGLIRATLLLPRFSETHGSEANTYGLAVALLWLVHPLNSEAVDYLSCRTELLVGLFYLATMFFAAMAFKAEWPRNWMVAAVAVCALGMGSKEVMVSAPLLVVLYDRLFAAGSFGAALRQRRVFYLGLAATWLVVAFYQMDNPRGDSVLFNTPGLSVLDYFRTQLTVIVHYLRLCFWPNPLILDSQDWPIVREFSAALILPLLLLAGFGFAIVLGFLRRSWWSILGAWFFAILAPTSSFIPIVTEIVSERRMYLPLAALVVLVVFTFDYAWRWVVGHVYSGGMAVRIVPALVLIAIVTLFGSMTYARNLDYRTKVTIWGDTVAKRPGNSRAQENLGKALMEEGRYPESVVHLREALRLYPIFRPKKDMAEIYSSLGAALSNIGNFQDASAMHRQALALRPNDAMLYYHLGNTYLRANDMIKAAIAFRRSIDLAPDFSPAHGNLALILMQEGDEAGAEQHFQRLLELADLNVNSYLIYADFLIRQGRLAEAVSLYRLGISKGIMPEDLTGRLNLLFNTYPETVIFSR